MRNVYFIKCKKIIKLKISYFCYKTLFPSSICKECRNEDEKIFMEQESIEIIKILGLISNKKSIKI